MQGAFYEAHDPFGHPGFYAQPVPAVGPPWAFLAQAPPAQAQQAGADEVRTVFITGFPEDVRERELNNMLRFLPGYEASQMHFRNGQAQGFALFVNNSLARGAVEAIQNLVFDNDCVLRAEMAHKNMYLKDDPTLATKRSRPSHESTSYVGFPPGAAGVGVAPPAAYGGYAMAPAAAGPGGAPPGVVPPMQPRGYAPISNTKDNPPCNTLFIGNLGDGINEVELRGLFSHQPGFQQLKLVRGPKGVSCFIEFADIPTAMAVHDAQQGAILASSDRGGIRIQYSKNPFGRKRDAAGAFLAAEGGGPPAAGGAPQLGVPGGGYAGGGHAGGGPNGMVPRAAADMQQGGGAQPNGQPAGAS